MNRESFQKKIISVRVRGFTLIEMIVAVALFIIVMLVALGALISISGADSEAQGIQAVVNNLNFALDDMTRNLQTGVNYHCTDGTGETDNTIGGLNTGGGVNNTENCSTNGSSYISFLELQPDLETGQNDQIVYWFSSTCADGPGGATFNGYTVNGVAVGCLERSTNGGNTYLPLTSPEISIDDMRFFVVGAPPAPADTTQPKVTMRLTANFVVGTATTTLHLDTSVTQRTYDAP